MQSAQTKDQGFTLVELLIVIGVLTILLAIVLVAINPARQFSQANNTQRRSNVNGILNAVNQYMSANKGTTPTGVDTTERTMCKGTACGTAPATVDICTALVPTYLADLPHDPGTGYTSPGSGCADYNTGYTISKTSANRVTVSAPQAEISETITVTR